MASTLSAPPPSTVASGDPFDLVVVGGRCVTPGGEVVTDVGVRGGRIAALGDLRTAPTRDRFEAAGLVVLPGVIDAQVHLREPGLEHKEDLATGTTAAILGGVTAVLEMPNTTPPTTSPAALADKIQRATGRARCDFAFFLGATPENAAQLGAWETAPGCAGIKVFMGSSTGTLLVPDDEAVARVLHSGRRRVSVHAEDEPRLRSRKASAVRPGDVRSHPEWRDEETAVLATRRLLTLARAARRRVHVLHVTTAEELPLLADARDLATFETTPHHLTMTAPDCYDRLGTLAQMNPPVREARHREALWAAVRDGLLDVIATDHAPHTREEKAWPYPDSPSGMPGVQTLVPLMLDHVNAGRLSLARFVDLLCAGPARVHGIAGKGRLALGYDADLTIVDLAREETITNGWIASRCGWTPYDGVRVRGWPVATVVRGRVVMRDGAVLGDARGAPLRFLEAL